MGLGKIGSRTARFCRAFGMTVLAYDPYLDADEIERRGAHKVKLAELLSRSDYVSLHCPRTRETENMFDAAAFARMKQTAYFINTARGLIHNEGALLDALRNGTIAGAGLDVFDEEQPPASAAARQWIQILRPSASRLINPAAWPSYSARFEQVVGFRPDPLP